MSVFLLFWFPPYFGSPQYSYRGARPNVPLENLFFYGAMAHLQTDSPHFYKLEFLCESKLLLHNVVATRKTQNFAAELYSKIRGYQGMRKLFCLFVTILMFVCLLHLQCYFLLCLFVIQMS